MNKTGHSLQRGFIHFSIAIFMAGLMTIGTFFSNEVHSLINNALPKTTPLLTIPVAQQQTPIGYGETVATPTVSAAIIPSAAIVTTATAAVQTPAVTAVSLAIPTGTKDCGTDINCFIAAANTCAPAAVNYADSSNLFGYISVNAIADLQTSPTADGSCLFTDKTLTESFATNATGQQLALSEGLSQGDINSQLASLSAAANKQTIGSVLMCALPSNDLATIITNWTHGNMSTDDFSGYQCTTVNPPLVIKK
jgi:hypothetical protein